VKPDSVPFDPAVLDAATRAACAAAGVTLGAGAAEKLVRYAELLRAGSARMNLTAVLDDRGIAVKHYADSLSVLPILLDEAAAQAGGGTDGFTLLDLGTGAGFPGIPLRIAIDDLAAGVSPADGTDRTRLADRTVPAAPPRIRILLLDALAKRVGFLRESVAALGLADIEAVHARAEDAGRGPLREGCGMVAARAVAPLNVLLESALPLVRTGGLFVAMKGPDAASETVAAGRALKLLGGRIESVRTLVLPVPEGEELTRSLVLVRKEKPCPPGWPRQAGKPEKAPVL